MATIKQYVNLPAGTNPDHGNSRDLRIAPNNVPNVRFWNRVEWWIEPAPGATNTSVTYISPSKRTALEHAKTWISILSGDFTNKITFSPVGGDKFVVKVAKEGQRGSFRQTADDFETWRKLYYTVFYMGRPALNLFNSLEADFKAAFAEGFIELENVQKTAALTEQARVDLSVRASIGRPNLHFLAGASSPTGIIDLRPQGTGTLTNKPYHVAILVVPDVYRLEDFAKTLVINSAIGTDNVAFRLFASRPVYTGTVRWGTVPAQNVVAQLSLVGTPTDASSTYRWDLRGVAGLTMWLAGAGHTAQLDVSLVKETTVMGYSIKNLVVVRTIDGLTDVLETFTHEVGHAVKQAVKEEPKWTEGTAAVAPVPQPVEANPKWHTDNFGGRGNHCSTNATLVNLPAGHPSGLTAAFRYGGAGLLCTMFYAGEQHVDPKGKFCSICVPRLKRADLGNQEMLLRWNEFG